MKTGSTPMGKRGGVGKHLSLGENQMLRTFDA